MTQPPTAPPMVPAWVDGRLRAIVNVVPPIHFEHSMYGPITAYLHTFFPPDQSFMIKPQGMLRPEHYPFSNGFDDIGADDAPRKPKDKVLERIQGLRIGDKATETRIHPAPLPKISDRRGSMELGIPQHMDDNSTREEPEIILDPDTSIASDDSYGAGVKSTNKGIRYPDFIIVKATESLVDDTILLVVEVKKDDDSLEAARLQIRNYLKMAATKRRVAFLQGLLIMGAMTECYFLDDDLDGSPSSISPPVPFHTTGSRLKTRIHRVAVENR